MAIQAPDASLGGSNAKTLEKFIDEMVGFLVTRPSDGVVEGRNPKGQLIGHYNPRTNETRNMRGEMVRRGNALKVLLGGR